MSRRWDEPEFRRDLDRLLRHARKTAKRGPAMFTGPELPESRLFRTSRGRSPFGIEGDALPLLRSLQRRIVGPSRAKYGMSTDEARALLMECCSGAVEGTIKGAVAMLFETLESDPVKMTVAETTGAIFLTPKLKVARTVYWKHVPRWLATKRQLETFAPAERFRAPICVTEVTCRGFSSALVLARHRFAESGAILDLAAPPEHLGSDSYWVSAGPRRGGFVYRHPGWVLQAALVKGERLVPPFLQLSRAAAKDEGQRSEWERRLLAATHWYSRAYRNEWPAHRLSNAMAALECVWIPTNQTGNLGPTIAKRLSERSILLHEFSRKQQQKWLGALYEGRKKAVHEGWEYVDDIDVDRLLELTSYVIRGMSVHLIPDHRTSRRSCRTFDEAMGCSLPPTAYAPRRRRAAD